MPLPKVSYRMPAGGRAAMRARGGGGGRARARGGGGGVAAAAKPKEMTAQEKVMLHEMVADLADMVENVGMGLEVDSLLEEGKTIDQIPERPFPRSMNMLLAYGIVSGYAPGGLEALEVSPREKAWFHMKIRVPTKEAVAARAPRAGMQIKPSTMGPPRPGTERGEWVGRTPSPEVARQIGGARGGRPNLPSAAPVPGPATTGRSARGRSWSQRAGTWLGGAMRGTSNMPRGAERMPRYPGMQGRMY